MLELIGLVVLLMILVFRGHRIHMRSFRSVEMPDGVVVIETRAL